MNNIELTREEFDKKVIENNITSTWLYPHMLEEGKFYTMKNSYYFLFKEGDEELVDDEILDISGGAIGEYLSIQDCIS